MEFKVKRNICFIGLILSVIGVIVMTFLGVFYVVVVNNANIAEIFFGLIISFFSLLMGIPIMGYEGRGTPLNIGINVSFYALIILAFVFFIVFISIPKQQTAK